MKGAQFTLMLLLSCRYIEGTKAREHALPVEKLSEPLRSQILSKKKRKRSTDTAQSVAPTLHDLTKRSCVLRSRPSPLHLRSSYVNIFHVFRASESSEKHKFVAKYDESSRRRQKRSVSGLRSSFLASDLDFAISSLQSFNQDAHDRMTAIMNHKDSVNAENCVDFKDEELVLPGDVSYSVEVIFSPQARTALRLSHFLSNFLQNIDMYEEYGNLQGDKFLNVEQLFGEALANVMGDLKIKGSGIFYDIDKFVGPDGRTRQFFGPYAYRYEREDEGDGGSAADRANTHFRAIDYAGFPDHYLDEPWFKNVKERWQSNTYGLTKFTEKPMIRFA